MQGFFTGRGDLAYILSFFISSFRDIVYMFMHIYVFCFFSYFLSGFPASLYGFICPRYFPSLYKIQCLYTQW